MVKGRDQFSIREPQYLENFKPFSENISFAQIADSIKTGITTHGKPLDCLDSMAGIGIVGRKIRQMINNLHIVYQDKSEKMLASDKYDENDKRVLCDAAKLSLPDDSFDIVLCRAGLNNISKEDYPKVLREYVRVLRNGGIGVLQDHFAQTPKIKETINLLETRMSRMEGKDDETYVPTIEELKTLIIQAGGKVRKEQSFEIMFSLKKRFAAKGINQPDLSAFKGILAEQSGLINQVNDDDIYLTYPGITISFVK